MTIRKLIAKTISIIKNDGPFSLFIKLPRRVWIEFDRHVVGFFHKHLYVYRALRLLRKDTAAKKKALEHGGADKDGTFIVTDIVKSGYAIRSIVPFSAPDGSSYLVDCDVGDNTVSIIPISGRGFHSRRVIRFPEWSAPMAVSAVSVRNRGAHDRLFIASFNLDYTSSALDETYLCYIDYPDGFRNGGKIGDIAKRVIQRNGYYGFRGVSSYETADGTTYIATVDREKDVLYIIELPPGEEDIPPERIHSVSLEYPDRKAEPIFVALVSTPDSDVPFCALSQRDKQDITLVRKTPGGEYEISQRIDIGSASRSSVAAGRFRNADEMDLAIGIWGGDPKEINTVLTGRVGILSPDGRGGYAPPSFFDAGIHTTDVVAGDFDGDGLDELAVLNYGAGLNTRDRIHPGGIQFYKFKGERFELIGEVPAMYPRIGLAIDIDGDGRDELVASLFFEKRLIVVDRL